MHRRWNKRLGGLGGVAPRLPGSFDVAWRGWLGFPADIGVDIDLAMLKLHELAMQRKKIHHMHLLNHSRAQNFS